MKKLFTSFLLICSTAFCATERPNIIFLLADDMRWDSLGHLGIFEVKTPTLDKLAEKGVRFTRNYNTTAICMASRAQIMTGLYEFSTGSNFLHGNLAWQKWENSYPMMLRKNGYFTGFAGKFGFHLNDEEGKALKGGATERVINSFDWWSGWMGQGSYQMKENREAREYKSLYGDKAEHTTYALGLMGRDFIKKAKASGKPFCLSISFKAPHTPLATDPRYDAIYEGIKFTKPTDFNQVDSLPAQAKSGRPMSKGKSWIKSYDDTMKKYHTMIFGMDKAIAMIMEELKAQDVHKNTIIIFTSDNGHHNGSKGLGGKLYAYEVGSLAPAIIYDPRHETGSKFKTIDALSGNIDFHPTILDYAGVAKAAPNHGKSLASLIKGETERIHDAILLINVWGIASAQSLGVVTDYYKYINWFYGAGEFTPTEELFNLKKDQYEQNTLAANPEAKPQLDTMRKIYDNFLEQWKKEHVKNAGYDIYVQLADRNIPFSEHSKEVIASMYTDDKSGKSKKDKKEKKATDKK
jgi:arylsulfatase A-like enzyme